MTGNLPLGHSFAWSIRITFSALFLAISSTLSSFVKYSHPPWAPGPSNLVSIFPSSLAIDWIPKRPYSLWSTQCLPVELKISISDLVKAKLEIARTILLSKPKIIELTFLSKETISAGLIDEIGVLFLWILLTFTSEKRSNSDKTLSPLKDLDNVSARASRAFFDLSLVEP